MAGLKGKKKRFFEEYKKDCNGCRAAIAAGYAEGSAKQRAYKLLHEDADIIATVKEWERQQHEEKTAERNEVIEFLSSVMRGQKIENIPIFVGDGVQEFTEGKPSRATGSRRRSFWENITRCLRTKHSLTRPRWYRL